MNYSPHIKAQLLARVIEMRILPFRSKLRDADTMRVLRLRMEQEMANCSGPSHR